MSRRVGLQRCPALGLLELRLRRVRSLFLRRDRRLRLVRFRFELLRCLFAFPRLRLMLRRLFSMSLRNARHRLAALPDRFNLPFQSREFSSYVRPDLLQLADFFAVRLRELARFVRLQFKRLELWV